MLRRTPGLRIPPIHCFGFGDGHDAELLQGIADACDGQYSYLRTAQEIPAAFADILGGLLSSCAKDIEVRLFSVHACLLFESHFPSAPRLVMRLSR